MVWARSGWALAGAGWLASADVEQMPALLEHADRLGTLGAEAADAAERDGRLPESVVEEIRASGLAGIGLPPELGGTAGPPACLAEVVERVAIGDAATAWVVMISGTAGLASVYLPPEAARRVWADGSRTLVAGVFAPRGSARPDGDGYRVSGRWPFASGVLHASWVSGGALVEGGDGEVHTAYFPTASVEILDTWHVMGLEATGSHDFAVDDAYVPPDLMTAIDLSEPWSPEPLYRFPLYGLLAVGVAAVCLGAAKGAIEDVIALATGKVPTGSRRTLAERPSVQEAVARATARLASARCHLHDVIGLATVKSLDGDPLDDRDRAGLRMAATNAVEIASEVVDEMYRVGGGTSLYRTSALQRRFRDIHTAGQHMMVARPTWEVAGRTLLGLGEGHRHL